MLNEILLYTGSVVIILWGAAHIVVTKSVVSGFGEISADNRRIITMEWLDEGLTLCFIGLLVLFTALWGGGPSPVSCIVYTMSAAMLLVLAGVSLFTGARTSIIPIKICPIVKTAVALLFVLGSML
jgi:hypothetical protein